jgi:hypothetical protein
MEKAKEIQTVGALSERWESATMPTTWHSVAEMFAG